jgi:hypothetical protein
MVRFWAKSWAEPIRITSSIRINFLINNNSRF